MTVLGWIEPGNEIIHDPLRYIALAAISTDHGDRITFSLFLKVTQEIPLLSSRGHECLKSTKNTIAKIRSDLRNYVPEDAHIRKIQRRFCERGAVGIHQ